MRLLATVLLLAASPFAHAAEPALPPCAQAIRFSADWFPDPPQEFDKTSDFLVKQGAPAGAGATALGLVTVDNAISVVPEKACHGLTVQLRFVNPVLRVRRSMPSWWTATPQES